MLVKYLEGVPAKNRSTLMHNKGCMIQQVILTELLYFNSALPLRGCCVVSTLLEQAYPFFQATDSCIVIHAGVAVE